MHTWCSQGLYMGYANFPDSNRLSSCGNQLGNYIFYRSVCHLLRSSRSRYAMSQLILSGKKFKPGSITCCITTSIEVWPLRNHWTVKLLINHCSTPEWIEEQGHANEKELFLGKDFFLRASKQKIRQGYVTSHPSLCRSYSGNLYHHGPIWKILLQKITSFVIIN